VDKQLRYIQMEQRDALAMRGAVKDLSNVEREAVAAYVQSLGPQASAWVGSAQ
jgi:cytochrome c553